MPLIKPPIAENEARAQVDAINGAVVGKAGSVFVGHAPNVASHSRKIGVTTGVTVEGYTLNRVLNERNLNEVDLLKVDIEGAEYPLFKETPESVMRRFKRIGLEYHANGAIKELFDRVESAGSHKERYPKKGISGFVEFTRKGRL